MKLLNPIHRQLVFHLLLHLREDGSGLSVADFRDRIDATREKIRHGLQSLPDRLDRGAFPLHLEKLDGSPQRWRFVLEKPIEDASSPDVPDSRLSNLQGVSERKRPTKVPHYFSGTPGKRHVYDRIVEAAVEGKLRVGTVYTPAEIAIIANLPKSPDMPRLMPIMAERRCGWKFTEISRSRYLFEKRRILSAPAI